MEFMNRMFFMQNMELLSILPSSPLNKGSKIAMKHSGIGNMYSNVNVELGCQTSKFLFLHTIQWGAGI